MAWWNDGDWTGLPADEAVPSIMANLACALSERCDAFGMAAINWKTAKGDKTYPVATDFDGFPFESYQDNLNLFQSNALLLLSAYPGTTSSAWYKHDLTPSTTCVASGHEGHRAYEGYSTTDPDGCFADFLNEASGRKTWVTPQRVQNAAMWNQMRQVIDEFRYCRAPQEGLVHEDVRFSVGDRKAGWDAAWVSGWAGDDFDSGATGEQWAGRNEWEITVKNNWLSGSYVRILDAHELRAEFSPLIGSVADAPIIRANRFMGIYCASEHGQNPLNRVLRVQDDWQEDYRDIPVEGVIDNTLPIQIGEGEVSLPYGTHTINIDLLEADGTALDKTTNPFADLALGNPPGQWRQWLNVKYYIGTVIDTEGYWTYGKDAE